MSMSWENDLRIDPSIVAAVVDDILLTKDYCNTEHNTGSLDEHYTTIPQEGTL